MNRLTGNSKKPDQNPQKRVTRSATKKINNKIISINGNHQESHQDTDTKKVKFITKPSDKTGKQTHIPQQKGVPEYNNLQQNQLKGKNLNIQLKMISSEQLTEILNTFRDSLGHQMTPPHTTGMSFSKCTMRFNGDRKDLEHFVNTVLVFKDTENIKDDVALKSFPLLLTGDAGIWWQGIKDTVTSFEEAIELLKSNYEIVKQAHQIYMEIFATSQGETKTDIFVCQKRALFSKLPRGQLSESVQLDMIYGLLSFKLRSKIGRGDIETFSDLITKARHVEALFSENHIKKDRDVDRNKSNKYCRYCRLRGHEIDECTKRGKVQVSKSHNNSNPTIKNLNSVDNKNEIKPIIKCYGCNEPGVIKSNCPKCKSNKPSTSICSTNLDHSNRQITENGDDDIIASALKSFSFASLSSTIQPHPRPLVIIQILNETGSALIDTAAKSCIASEKLSIILQKHYLEFDTINLPIILADGSEKTLVSLVFKVDVMLKNKLIPTTFIAFPEANVQHTLLGIDFITAAQLVLDFSNSKWKFADSENWFEMIYEHDPPRKLVDVFSLQMLLGNEGLQLSVDEKIKVNSLLNEHSAIFTLGGEPTSFAEHRIVLDNPNCTPIAVPPYRLNSEKQNILKTEIDKMLQDGVVEECESPWAAPVVLVPKPDKSFRVCIDYRKLNAITVADKYPMPQIDDLLQLAKETVYMSTIDLKSGYWQVPVAEADRDKTAFVTLFGLYRFKRMPFGLKNAPATFQRLINRFKSGLPDITILAYLDDIIVLSKTFEQHYNDLKRVFEHLKQYNLVANRDKCCFFKNEVKYLGHLITTTGIKVNPGKVSAIKNMPLPKNIRHLKSFLQTCSWYRKFVPNFANICRPLSELTRKASKWKWTDQHSIAFQTLKDLLVTAPILKQIDETQPFILRTDASNYALGAVLLQGVGPDERPIEYASRLLSSAERNYNTTEREALAVIWALKKFRGYIDGSEVEVSTDHQALKWLMSLRSPSGRLARWVLLIQSHNIKITYTPGKANVIADMLSRPSCEDNSTCGICSIQIDVPQKGSRVIRQSQLEDEALNKIITSFETPEDPNLTNWIDRGYLVEGGVLYRYNPDSDSDEPQLVIPTQSQLEILKSCHSDLTAGHIGIEPTFKKISSKYYWLGMRRSITEFVKACPECQRYKITNLKPAGLLKTPVMAQRSEVLAIDLFGPLVESTEGYKHILVIEDIATKWTELFPLKNANAESVAKMLINEWFLRFGVPRRLISDNGTQFVSQVMQQVSDFFGIHQNLTPKYHPQANPVERRNRDIKTKLAILVQDNHGSWPNFLPAIRFSLNSTISESVGYTPAYLTFGRELRNISDVLHDTRPIICDDNFIPQISPFLLQMDNVIKNARETHEIRQDGWKYYADMKRRSHKLKSGDLVLVKTQLLSDSQRGVTAKFVPKRDGPYRVRSFKSSTSCEIGTVNNDYVGTYHVSHLTPYVGDSHNPIRHPIRKRGRPPTSHLRTGDTSVNEITETSTNGSCSSTPLIEDSHVTDETL